MVDMDPSLNLPWGRESPECQDRRHKIHRALSEEEENRHVGGYGCGTEWKSELQDPSSIIYVQ